MSRLSILALAALLIVGTAGNAAAQDTRVGATQFPMPPDGGTRRFSSVAYDKSNDAFLVTWGVINLGARFVSASGTPLGSPVALNTDGAGRQAGAARVACGAEINACLVAWVEESPTRIVGRFVRYSAGSVSLISDRFVINANGNPKHTESAPSVAYSSAAQEFLVAWAEYPGPDVKAQRVSPSGAPVGSEIPIATSGNWEGLPSATYNSTNDEYMVAYYFEPGFDAVGGTRVKAGSGAVLGNTTLFAGSFEKYPEIAYNSVNNEYFAITWSSGFTLHGRRFNASGVGITEVDTLALGGGDGIGIGYNPVSNSYLAVYLHTDSNEIFGSVISASGTPGAQFMVTSSGTRLATQPQAAGSTIAPQWLSVASENFRQVMSQLVQSGASTPQCTFSLSSSSASFGNHGGSGGVTLNASASTCAWTASSNASWLTLSSSSTSGTGSRTINYSVASNGVTSPRSATLTIGGRSYTVSQAAAVDPAIARERGRSDFDGDGKYDILWHEQTLGYVAAWTLDGTRLLDSVLLSHRVSDINWQIAGTGDFNADGKPDLVWQHRTEGWVGVWYMNGTTLIDSVYFSVNRVVDTGWKIVGVGDFNGDGKPDLAWQHSTQRWLAVWLLDGVTLVGSELMSPNQINDVRWQIVGIGDINRDGKSDLVWRHTENGQIASWLMNGLSLVSSIALGPGVVADNNWKIVGIVDANADGKADLLWHHATEGWVGAWYLNGDNLIESVSIGPGRVSDVKWKVVGPR